MSFLGFLLGKKGLEQSHHQNWCCHINMAHQIQRETETLVFQISIANCTCRSATKINSIACRRCMVMNFSEINQLWWVAWASYRLEISKTTISYCSGFVFIFFFFFSFCFTQFHLEFDYFFPRTFTSVLYSVRIIFLVSLFSNLIFFL